jgi:uncharacterized membrane protein YphA (DoxX/SURF4 family)
VEKESIENETNSKSRAVRTAKKVALLIARLALGYLFFTQLLWKMPPRFGCPPDFAFTTGDSQSGRVTLTRTSGLCDWVGIEEVWANQPRRFFVADMQPIGGPRLALDLSFLARLNGQFIRGFVQPNIRWFGWVIWGMEAFIFLSLFLGVFTRLGGLVAVAQSAQLWIGLAGISVPYEWEWTYTLMVVLSLLMLAFAPGGFLGLDGLISPRLEQAAKNGNRVAKAALWLV